MRRIDHNIQIDTGMTFAHEFTWVDAQGGDPVDLSSYTATMRIVGRDGTALHTATTANGQVVLDADAGTITVVLPSSATSTLDAGHGNRYSLVATTPGGHPTLVARGHVNIAEVAGL